MRFDCQITPYNNMSRWEGFVIAVAYLAVGLLALLLVPFKLRPPNLSVYAAIWVAKHQMRRMENENEA